MICIDKAFTGSERPLYGKPLPWQNDFAFEFTNTYRVNPKNPIRFDEIMPTDLR